MKALTREAKEKIIPLLFSISITWWILDCFVTKTKPQTLILVFLLHTFVFLGMMEAGKSNLGLFLFLAGTLIYFVIVFLILATARDDNRTGFLVWIATLEPNNNSVFVDSYWVGTVCLVSYMFSAIIFYFSCIRDRIVFLFMTGCIPLILHTAKTDKGVTLPFILFVVIFFILYIGKNSLLSMNTNNDGFIEYTKDPLHSKSRHNRIPRTNGILKKWYLVSVTCFVIIVTGLSMILPKFLTSPKLAEFDLVVYQVIRPLINAGRHGGDIQRREIYSLQFQSEQTDLENSAVPVSDRILFMVEADEPLYLRIQSRDQYEKNRWITGNQKLTLNAPIDNFCRRHLKLNILSTMIGHMHEQDLRKLGFSNPEIILQADSILQKDAMATVLTNQVQSDCYLTVPGICNLTTEKQYPVLINELGFCVSSDGENPGIFERYTLDYINQKISPASLQMAVVQQMNPEIYNAITKNRQALYEQYENSFSDLGFSESEIMAVLFDADKEMKIAIENFTALPANLPQRIYQLAASITQGETSDYRKAKAIENFFHSSGFRYDASPPRLPYDRDINDYFLFESKRGFCIHFASAMVILARACGLPARYTEGYSVSEPADSNRYYVRAKDAHAFPEIYISGVGWMVFEPTVSETGNEFLVFISRLGDEIKGFAEKVTRMVQSAPTEVKLLFVPFILFALLYMLWLISSLRYHTWLKRTRKSIENSDNHALNRIFSRIVSLLKLIRFDMKKADTPSLYASRILSERGINISTLAELHNRAMYGNHQLSPDELEKALDLYKSAASEIKACVGRPNSWFIH